MLHGTCVVWWADLSLLRAGHLELLDETELGRRRRYRRSADRDRFTLAAALLRLAGAAELGGSPVKLSVTRQCVQCGRPHGRPRIAGTDLNVSVSHAGDVVAVATTRAGAVGVDVEQITEIGYTSLLRQVLTPYEESNVRSVRDFLVYWTRKESVLKATGDGLFTDMREVEVSAPSAPARLLRYGTRRPDATMADVQPGAGYAAAVTVLTNNPVAIRELSAAELLQADA